MHDADPAHPRISVIIPVYNAQDSIRRTIDSILGQTWPAHEIIVVDDGSTDATAERVLAYGDKVIYHLQRNSGPSVARNRGVALASGDWIAFLDADDWFYPHRLQTHGEMIRHDESADFLVAGYDYRDTEGTFVSRSIDNTRFGKELIGREGENGRAILEGEQIGRFMEDQFSDTRGLCISKKTFQDLGGFDPDLRICEDVVFFLRACAVASRVGVALTSVAVYLVHEQGLIRSNRLRAQTETIRALSGIAGEMARAPAPVHAAWRHLLKRAYQNLAFHHAKGGERKAALNAAAKGLRIAPSIRDFRIMLSLLR